jgi:tRNA modification GTPase
VLRKLHDPADGEPIDKAVLLWLPGPASFTGEDVLEVQHHGSPAVLALLLEALGRIPGLRLAEPGEFARRAFLNGRLDLTEVEALADLIDAGTRAQARQALRQLDGGLGRLYASWRQRMLDVLMRLEAEIDFGEEGVLPEGVLAIITPAVRELQAAMAAHLADGRCGERLRQGFTVAVMGAPNAGKSSLVNLLARREIAIVTPVPGTTRDVLEVALELDGLPVTLLDTAGLRETDDPVEAIGVERARTRAAAADLRLGLIDATAPDWPSVEGADLIVVNKVDLAPGPFTKLAISCVTGAGIAELLARLAALTRERLEATDAPIITRARHREAVDEACETLTNFLQAQEAGVELALLAEDVRLAARALGRVTGAVGVEEILDAIFASFCLGK